MFLVRKRRGYTNLGQHRMSLNVCLLHSIPGKRDQPNVHWPVGRASHGSFKTNPGVTPPGLAAGWMVPIGTNR